MRYERERESMSKARWGCASGQIRKGNPGNLFRRLWRQDSIETGWQGVEASWMHPRSAQLVTCFTHLQMGSEDYLRAYCAH